MCSGWEYQPIGFGVSCGVTPGAYIGIGYNSDRSRSLGPLVEVPVDGLFFKESSTRLSGKHLLFEPYLDHSDNYSQGDQFFKNVNCEFLKKR